MYVLWFFLKSVVWSLALLGLTGVLLDIVSSSGLNCFVAVATAGPLLAAGLCHRWTQPYSVAVIGGLSMLGLVVLLAAADWSVAATLFVIGSSAHGAFVAVSAACVRLLRRPAGREGARS